MSLREWHVAHDLAGFPLAHYSGRVGYAVVVLEVHKGRVKHGATSDVAAKYAEVQMLRIVPEFERIKAFGRYRRGDLTQGYIPPCYQDGCAAHQALPPAGLCGLSGWFCRDSGFR